MRVKQGAIVAVSSITNSGVKYGRVVALNGKNAIVDIGGNTVTAQIKHVTPIWEKNLLAKLREKFGIKKEEQL